MFICSYNTFNAGKCLAPRFIVALQQTYKEVIIMIEWISNNIGTIAVSTMLIIIVAVVIISMVKDKKKGRSSCGGECSRCRGCR